MEENNSKLFVFDKKEVFLIFIFILLIAVTSFTLGVRVGKELILKGEEQAYEPETPIELKTSKEEEIENLVKEVKPIGDKEVKAPSEYRDRLDEEFENTLSQKDEEDIDLEKETKGVEDTLHQTTEVKADEKSYSGKWTVQIVSFPDKESATEFSNGFVARGYDPIINTVDLGERGKWYRVSLGLFETKQEAINYISENNLIFGGKEYQIYKIK